jgi:hypothetical protein
MKTRHIVIALMFLVFAASTGIAQDSENMTLIGREASGRCETVAARGDTVFFNSGANLIIMDFSDPDQPDTLAQVVTRGFIRKLVLFNEQVIIATESNDLLVIDISDIRNPQLVVSEFISLFDMVMRDSLLFVCGRSAENAFNIFDLSDPLEIRQVESLSLDYVPVRIAVANDMVLVAEIPGRYSFIDITDSQHPILVHSGFLEGRLKGIALFDQLAFISGYTNPEFHLLDISDPNTIHEIALLDLNRAARSMVFEDQILYLADEGTRVSKIDLADPAHPVELEHQNFPRGSGQELALSEHFIFVAASHAGLLALPREDPGPGFMPVEYFPGADLYFLQKYGDMLYTVGGSGLVKGIDISEKAHPKTVFESFVFHNADPIAMMNHHDRLILISTHDGMKIMDLTDPETPVVSQEKELDGWNRTATLGNDLVFVTNTDEELFAIDLESESLEIIPLLSSLGGAVNDLTVSEQVLYAARRDSNVQIIDCHDLDHPVRGNILDDSESANCVAVYNDYLYVGKRSTIKIYDLSDPLNPSLENTIDVGRTVLDIVLQDQFMVTLHGYGGVYVHDLFDPLAPTQIGHFDTFDFAKQVFLDLPHVYVADDRDGVYILRNDAVVSVDHATTAAVPGTFELLPAYPNPFNNSTTLAFSLPVAAKVSLSIHNLLGQTVRSWPDKHYSSGRHQVHWNGRSDQDVDLSSGIYFVKMQAGAQVALRKMVLVR